MLGLTNGETLFCGGMLVFGMAFFVLLGMLVYLIMSGISLKRLREQYFGAVPFTEIYDECAAKHKDAQR